MEIRIGTSGWSYAHWENVLYPPGLDPRSRLDFYTQHFDTVELNSCFYRWPTRAAMSARRRRLPANFVMSGKAPRGFTHGRRLYSPESWTPRIRRTWQGLGERTGILLYQLSPKFEYDFARLAYFLHIAAPITPTAIEFRHPSWNRPEVFELLERHQVGYCVMSGAGLPCVLRATASFVYLRLHGPDHHHLYAGNYSDDDLRWWADRIREWQSQGRRVYAYFNNDGHGHAVRNAWRLRELLA